jgi:hypothetical protein
MKNLKLFTIMLMVLGSLNVFAVEETGTDCGDVVNGNPQDVSDGMEGATVQPVSGSGTGT